MSEPVVTTDPRFLVTDSDGARWQPVEANRAQRWIDVLAFEHRADRAYDDQDASHLVVPHGAPAGTFSRPLCAAMGRAVLEQHSQAMWQKGAA